MGRIVLLIDGRGRQTIVDGGTAIGSIPDGRYRLRGIESGDAVSVGHVSWFSWRLAGIGLLVAAAAIAGGAVASSFPDGRQGEVVERLWRVCRIDGRGLNAAQLRDAESRCRQGRI